MLLVSKRDWTVGIPRAKRVLLLNHVRQPGVVNQINFGSNAFPIREHQADLTLT